jgi:DNA-directed RNA polymerase specialized sigma24 family protein
MVAVTIRSVSDALGRLDPESRALLDLSYRRGLDDSEIARFMRSKPGEIERRRVELFSALARELGLDGRDELAELQATLPDLPDESWDGAKAPDG